MQNLRRAALFAREAHEGQLRDGKGEPCIVHPMRVAGRTILLDYDRDGIDADEDMVVAAWLHDVIEDTSVTRDSIRREFGWRVEELVVELTNHYTKVAYPDLKRAERKTLELGRLADISRRALVIKLIDRIDNLRDINPTTPFAKVYSQESTGLVTLGERRGLKLAAELRDAIESLQARA